MDKGWIERSSELIQWACNRLNKIHKTNTANCSRAATLSRLSMASTILPKLIISRFHGSPAIPSSRRRLVLCLILLHNATQLNMLLQCPMEPSCESAPPGLHHACLFCRSVACMSHVSSCLYSHSPNYQTFKHQLSGWFLGSAPLALTGFRFHNDFTVQKSLIRKNGHSPNAIRLKQDHENLCNKNGSKTTGSSLSQLAQPSILLA